MRRAMIIMTFGLVFALPARSQDGARLVSRGVDVRVAGAAAQSSAGIGSGETIETGASSFAVVALDGGSRVALGRDTVAALEFDGAVAMVTLSRGSVRIHARRPLHVATPSGTFLIEDTPAEADFLLAEQKTEVRVYSGAVTALDVDFRALVFRGSEDRSVRAYRAGTIDRGALSQEYPLPWRPSIYIPYPYFAIGEPEPASEEPAPVPPGRGPRPGPDPIN